MNGVVGQEASGRPAAPAPDVPGPGVRDASPAIAFEHVTKRFESFTAVDDLCLEIPRGSFFSLLGPSGCGKTTTLRLVAGFERPTSGHVRLGGDIVDEVPPHRRDVHTVFQSYALFDHLDIQGNIAFPLRRAGVAKPEIRRRVGEILELVQLGERARSRVAQLSGGQRQRVALARALVNRPQVLLLDEPLAALDMQLRRGMQLELKRIQRELGITFLLVTHDQDEALSLSDRIAVMRAGIVEQSGVPEDIYERPVNSFVAGFVGVSNLLQAKIERGAIRLPNGKLVSMPTVAARSVEHGQTVHVSIRPEKLRLDPPVPLDAELEGVIIERVYQGTTTEVHVDTGAGMRFVVLLQNSERSVSDERLDVGRRVALGWRNEHILVLP